MLLENLEATTMFLELLFALGAR